MIWIRGIVTYTVGAVALLVMVAAGLLWAYVIWLMLGLPPVDQLL